MSRLFYRWNPYSAPFQPKFFDQLFGPLNLVTAPDPSKTVVGIAEAKTQCRVDSDAHDDDIQDLIKSATAWCEQEIAGHRQLLTATYDLPVLSWWMHGLHIPRPPLQSVTSITYTDTAGNSNVLATSIYVVRTPLRGPGLIERAPLQVWPWLQRDNPYPVTIRFIAGYGTPAQVPKTIKRAILMHTAWWFRNRDKADGWPPVEQAIRSMLDTEGYGSYA